MLRCGFNSFCATALHTSLPSGCVSPYTVWFSLLAVRSSRKVELARIEQRSCFFLRCTCLSTRSAVSPPCNAKWPSKRRHLFRPTVPPSIVPDAAATDHLATCDADRHLSITTLGPRGALQLSTSPSICDDSRGRHPPGGYTRLRLSSSDGLAPSLHVSGDQQPCSVAITARRRGGCHWQNCPIFCG